MPSRLQSSSLIT